MEAVTIAGQVFNVNPPYAAGHTLNDNEAAALNQTWVENIRNNQAKAVKEALEAGSFDHAAFQSHLDQYASNYQFGVRTGGGGRTSDPVMTEAMEIARQTVRDALKKAGKNLKDYAAKQISEAAAKLLAGPKGEQIKALAAQRVQEQQNAAQGDLADILGGMTPKDPE